MSARCLHLSSCLLGVWIYHIVRSRNRTWNFLFSLTVLVSINVLSYIKSSSSNIFVIQSSVYVPKFPDKTPLNGLSLEVKMADDEPLNW